MKNALLIGRVFFRVVTNTETGPDPLDQRAAHR